MLAFRTDDAIPDLLSAIETEDIDPADLGYVKQQLFGYRFTVTLLLFSGGRPMGELRPALEAALTSFEDFLNDERAPLEYVDLAIQTYYVEALWLLSLTKLLGLGDSQVERVANFYAADETNDGADELFELILAKLGRKSFEAKGLIHDNPYQLLLDCIKAEPDERPALMTKFLKRWFKGQKECDWWGSHINRRGTPVLDTGFFGYWAFEAALVTYLWEIDDSTYRDLPHYPKDLIDYARQNSSPASVETPQRLRAMAGEPCPREGFWVTPAKANSRRHFKAGEVMPDFKSDYGVTIWQWDSKQGN
jgi:Domain of unknown function (DUF1911)/Domain of unknown function (DUF1910)